MEEEGHSNRDVLQCVRRTAKLLLQKAIQECGFPGERINKDLISEQEELSLQRIKLTVELKIREYLAQNSEDSSHKEVMNEDEAKKELERLKEELLLVKLQHLQDSKMLKCLVHQELLFRQLSLSEDSTSKYQQLSSSGQFKHVSNFLQMTEELEELRSQLQLVQQERIELQEACRVLTSSKKEDGGTSNRENLEVNTSSVKDSEVERLRKETILYRHTLMSLITGSGVDWTETKELCDFVLLQQPQ